MKVYCFFEQSGTFKNAFIKNGFDAIDLDIKNDFNKTDIVIDLFQEINNCYDGKKSIFDSIYTSDLIFAFFPCIRFSSQASFLFKCTSRSLRTLSDRDKLIFSLKTHNELSFLFSIINKLCVICFDRKIKLIIENPYSSESYLTRYFVLKPSLIDFDRRVNGDFYKKPTQFFFINFEPKNNFYLSPFIDNSINVPCHKVSSNTFPGIEQQVARSLISSDYAERFIKRFIL